ncbi:MAG TPA: BLUF domain-containing protein [Casimicrobiaceae bacterium]|nr:BLUF domain-containing protein [Casimicrobiaceae bacterium]
MVRQIAFSSLARPGLRPADTSNIIGTSRSNNARDGITGALIYSGESFLQLVEGADAALTALWGRLAGDDRHRQLASLFDRSVAQRSFGDWRAGYMPEETLGSALTRWNGFTPPLPLVEVDALLEFLRDAETF